MRARVHLAVVALVSGCTLGGGLQEADDDDEELDPNVAHCREYAGKFSECGLEWSIPDGLEEACVAQTNELLQCFDNCVINATCDVLIARACADTFEEIPASFVAC